MKKSTGEILFVKMCSGEIHIIRFSSTEICETKTTCITCFEVSCYVTHDIRTLILLNIMACNVLKGKDTSFHSVECTLFSSDFTHLGPCNLLSFLLVINRGED